MKEPSYGEVAVSWIFHNLLWVDIIIIACALAYVAWRNRDTIRGSLQSRRQHRMKKVSKHAFGRSA